VSIWNNKEQLDKLEQMRAIKRGTGVLTFDCLNTIVRGDRVFCSRGKLLGQAKDGSLALIVVLRGITSGTCKDCRDYSSEEELE